jgi:hypothetical protein
MIYDDYAALWATGLREELIWPHLDKKYHLSEATIYRIVLKITRIKEKEITREDANGTDQI